MITRREFVSGLAATAGLAGARPGPASGEPPLETTRIRLVQNPSMCQAPQYVAEDLLRTEGFTEVQYVRKEGPYDIADALAGPAQRVRQKRPHGGVVVDDEDGRRGLARRRRRRAGTGRRAFHVDTASIAAPAPAG